MSTLSFNDSLKTAIHIAIALTKENNNESFSIAHLLKAIIHKEVGMQSFLKSLGKDINYINDWAQLRIDEYPKVSKLPEQVTSDMIAAAVFEEADNIRLKLNFEEVTPLCVLIALVKPNVGFSIDQLKSLPLKEKEFLDLYLSDQSIVNSVNLTSDSGGNVKSNKKSTNALLKYCIDRTSLAKEGKVDPIIGRDKETKMMLEILGRRTKPNVIITGEPGVGKTALIDGFALSIIANKVPENLKDAMLFELDLGSLFAGASYKGEVEDRLKSIIHELIALETAILFIDEIHTLLDPKGSGGGAANLLKPELARGAITVIGATTLDEYRKFIEPEQAFSRRFEVVKVDEPDISAATKMIQKLAPAFELHHNLKVEPSVMKDCVLLVKRYIKDRRLPDAAVDLLDRTMAAIKMMNQTSADDILEIKNDFDNIKILDNVNEKIRVQVVKSIN